MGMPPCSTWSRVRRRRIVNGPRPLRDRQHPYDCMPDRASREQRACDLGTYVLLRVMQILLAAGAAGAWVCLEHPRDWGA
eukprot:117502-Lingulodinium_polyedra.AAC.1